MNVSTPETEAAAQSANPAAVVSSSRKWLAIGSGIGIEIGERDLRIIACRVRPSGVSLLGVLKVENYAHTPAAEWGSAYAAFLKQHSLTHMTATVLLPRHEVVVRQVNLPGVSDKDLDGAIRFQADSLHPFPEDDVTFDWTRIGKTASVLVGFARRSLVDRYAGLCAEAGIKVSSFTFSAAAIYAALRIYGDPAPADGFLALDERGSETEAYGESTARVLFSATFDLPAERVRSLALSELRLPPATQSSTLRDILPGPVANPDNANLDKLALPYATALSNACGWLPATANLLPVEMRATYSRAMFIPTMVLTTLLLMIVGAMATYQWWDGRRYQEQIQAEIQRLQRVEKQVQKIDKDTVAIRNRTFLLDRMRRRAKNDLDALNELTHILPPSTWLSNLDVTPDQVTMVGETDQAAGLLKVIDASPLFEKAEFSTSLMRSAGGETFGIRAARRGQQ